MTERMRCPALCGAFVVWYHLRMTNDANYPDTTIEAIIRDLVALGDRIGETAIDLMMGLDGVNGNPQAIAIIERHLGRPMTDSDVDDLTDFIDSDDDTFND